MMALDCAEWTIKPVDLIVVYDHVFLHTPH